MNASPLGKFTRLRELVEDWEQVIKQYPQVQRLQDRAIKAHLALQEIQEALMPAIHYAGGQRPELINHAAEERRKVLAIESVIDRYFDI